MKLTLSRDEIITILEDYVTNYIGTNISTDDIMKLQQEYNLPYEFQFEQTTTLEEEEEYTREDEAYDKASSNAGELI